jgi:uncharacterized protein YjcR
MTELQCKVREKRNILREIYGGMMTLTDLAGELGMKRTDAKEWAREKKIGNLVGSRVKYETDEVARKIVEGRGMV